MAECSEREERCKRVDWTEEKARAHRAPGSLPDAMGAIKKFLVEKQHAVLYALG